MKTPTPKRKPPAKKTVVGRKSSGTRKQKKGPPPGKKATLKPITKAGSVLKKPCSNDRPTSPIPEAPLSFSTSSANQRMRVIEALRTGPKTTHDLRCLGIYQCPARVKELRDDFGYVIETTRVTLVDRDGYSHPGAGLYTLVSDPPQLSLDFGRFAANDPVPRKKGPSQ